MIPSISTAPAAPEPQFVPTVDQKRALDELGAFINDPHAQVFILKGYAGTGKTTLVRQIIKKMRDEDLIYTLLASTGRAAKILANATGEEVKTVHSEIYNFKGMNKDMDEFVDEDDIPIIDGNGQLYLNFQLTSADYCEGSHYYIIDEASMLSDVEDEGVLQAKFGTGKLLTDLFQFDRDGKFIFVGDFCQLPPVNQDVSPALDKDYLVENFSKRVYEAELLQIVRQEKGNDLVRSASRVRDLYFHPQTHTKWAKFPIKGYRNIQLFENESSLINRYVDCVKRKGFNAATLVCFSNKQCNSLTRLLRPVFGHHSLELEKGDLLLVTQNNLLSGLMNGDLVTVEEVSSAFTSNNTITFVPVTVRELFTGSRHTQLLIADVLNSGFTNLDVRRQKYLYVDFFIRMKKENIKQGTDKFDQRMREDPYLNALRAVYGYALTCHKAQGGEWEEVFLNVPRYFSSMDKPYVYQWMYTAMTRAKNQLYTRDDFWVI